jgi:hypothetical protein
MWRWINESSHRAKTFRSTAALLHSEFVLSTTDEESRRWRLQLRDGCSWTDVLTLDLGGRVDCTGTISVMFDQLTSSLIEKWSHTFPGAHR